LRVTVATFSATSTFRHSYFSYLDILSSLAFVQGGTGFAGTSCIP
jgi:hypothetical protein